MATGPLIIVSGPAGAGKSTLIRCALKQIGPSFRLAVSATTRPQLLGEIEGRYYYVWARARFAKAIEAGAFLEYATVHGRHYSGTPRSEVDRFREKGTGV